MKRPVMDRRALLRIGALLPGAAALMAAPAAAAPDTTCEPTKRDNKGPFYLSGAPQRASIAGPQEPGERVRIRGTVMAADCRTPLAGALVDVWQADASGEYHGRGQYFRLRGQILTNARGGTSSKQLSRASTARAEACDPLTFTSRSRAPSTSP